MKRILALLLLLGTVFALCACPGSGGPAGPGGELGNEPDPIDSIPNDQYNFRGDSLSISIRNDYVYEIYADSTSQEGIDPEVYKRNTYTERRFNFKIKDLQSLCTGDLDHTTHVNDVTLALQKGSFKFDVIFMWAFQSGKLVKGANYLDWRLQDENGYLLPYTGESLVNEADWWPAGINNASTVMGHQYIAISDMSISSMESAYSIVYNYKLVNNAKIAEGLGYRDMYDIVEQGDWTLDMLYNIVKDLYIDNSYNNNYGNRDDSDTYGFMFQRTTGIDAFINSLGYQCVKNDGKSMPTLWNMDQTLMTAAEDVVKLCTSKGAIDKIDTETDIKFFAEGHAYFATMKLAALRTATMHAMEDPGYGVLPYPKLNKAQENYLTGSDDHCSVFSIPLMIREDRYEIIGVTMEALSARTNQVVKKQFYDTMLKTNSTRNLQDEEMIDMIINGRVYDFMTYHHADLFVDKTATDGHLHAFFRYLVMQEPGLSPADYWARGEAVLKGGENIEGSLANLIAQYVNMYS